MALKRDPEATRQALLDAAETVFLEKGFGDTALSEIARRARITKSLIHHYFGSKEALWREVKQRRFDHYAKDQLAMLTNAEPVAELLRNSVKLYFRFLKNNPEIVRILAWMFLERDQVDCLLRGQELTEAGTAKIQARPEERIPESRYRSPFYRVYLHRSRSALVPGQRPLCSGFRHRRTSRGP